MTTLYPLHLQPDFRERPWGVRTLAPLYVHAVAPDAAPIGEVWLTGDDCRVANGTLKGKTLAEVSREFGRELVGTSAPEPERFPLLIKFIFTSDKLSVQVHPDDAEARKQGLPCGKTECWYAMTAEVGSKVGLGLKPGTTHAALEQAIAETRAEQLLNWVDIHPGDLFFVDAGTVHAIGPGVVFLETQQNSDTTYRLYDYGRPRPLHVKLGLAATKESTRSGLVRAKTETDGRITLVRSSFFAVEKHKLQAPLQLSTNGAAQSLVALEGCAVIECEGHTPVLLSRGEAAVIPASIDRVTVRPQWQVELAIAHVPTQPQPHPETAMPYSSLAVLNPAKGK